MAKIRVATCNVAGSLPEWIKEEIHYPIYEHLTELQLRLAIAMRTAKVQLLFAQEIFESQAKELAELLGMEYIFAPTHRVRTGCKAYGLAVLTKLHVKACKAIDYGDWGPGWAANDLDLQGESMRCILQIATVILDDGTEVRVAHTWGAWSSTGEFCEAQAVALPRLFAELDALDEAGEGVDGLFGDVNVFKELDGRPGKGWALFAQHGWRCLNPTSWCNTLDPEHHYAMLRYKISGRVVDGGWIRRTGSRIWLQAARLVGGVSDHFALVFDLFVK
jgi:hypothetical protein